MQPLTTTLADLNAAKLTDYARENMPPVPPISITAAPKFPIQGDEAIKALNLTEWEGVVYGGGIDGRMNGQNPQRLDRFNFLCKNWESGGKAPDKIPAWPAFLYIDMIAFGSWWTQTQANQGNGMDAPDPYFVKYAPALPPVVIVAEGTAPANPDANADGPIDLTPIPGNPGLFHSSQADSAANPDGKLYFGQAGVYRKHVYFSMFSNGVPRVVWEQLQFAA